MKTSTQIVVYFRGAISNIFG